MTHIKLHSNIDHVKTSRPMAQLTILYWRDIPSQVIVKAGRRNEKRLLPALFQEAIDMAAMRSGAAATDDYLEEWRRDGPHHEHGRPKHQPRTWSPHVPSPEKRDDSTRRRSTAHATRAQHESM